MSEFKFVYTKDIPIGGKADMHTLLRDYFKEEDWDIFHKNLEWMQKQRAVCGCAIGDPVLCHFDSELWIVECTTCGCTFDFDNNDRPRLYLRLSDDA